MFPLVNSLLDYKMDGKKFDVGGHYDLAVAYFWSSWIFVLKCCQCSDISFKMSTNGNKRTSDVVSPSSSCGSPDLKTQITENQLSFNSKSKMADSTGEEIPAWFLRFDKDFEQRVMNAVGKKVEECLVQSKEARDLAGEARDTCEDLENRLDTVTGENRDPRKQVEFLQET